MAILKRFLLYSILFVGLVSACRSNGHNGSKQQTSAYKATAPGATFPTSVNNDEILFRKFLSAFKTAVKQRNKKLLLNMLYYPLQTSPQWSNADLDQGIDLHQQGLLNRDEILAYMEDIFSNYVTRLVPKSSEDDLSAIDAHTDEDYYLKLWQVTDKGSMMYELQKQYVQDNGKETSFGFVFGKVNGNYKVISYYTPWPLKG